MPRIIVTTEPSAREQADVLLDEEVHSVHLSTDHAAAQLVQRLAWAIGDAEAAEHTRPQPRLTAARRPGTLAAGPPGAARLLLGA